MLLYAITDRSLYPGEERERWAALVRQAARWAESGAVDVIQIREKDLAQEALERLAREIVRACGSSATRVVLNGPAWMARRVGAGGVHLASRATSGAALAARIAEVRTVGAGERNGEGDVEAWISVACHSVEEVAEARELGAAAVVFGPVFEKPARGAMVEGMPGVGLAALRAACEAAGEVPVFALGGVVAESAAACAGAGAGGVAGIRLFAGDGWRQLRRGSLKAGS